MKTRRLTLRARLLITGVSITAISMLIVGLISVVQAQRTATLAANVCADMVRDDLGQISKDVQSMCELTQREIATSLGVARSVLARQGEVVLSKDRTIAWKAKNQFSGDVKDITLPQALIAG